MSKLTSILLATSAAALGVVEPPVPIYKYSAPAVTEVSAIPTCRDGSEYSESGCAKVFTADPSLDCPHPYKLTMDNLCVTHTYGKSSLSCEAGSYLSGAHCIQEITEPVDIYCNQGELTKEGCIVSSEPEIVKDDIQQVELKCPVNYKLDNDVCIHEISESSEKICLEGFEMKNGRCHTIEKVSLECDKGYTLSNTNCIVMEVASVINECPRNTIQDENGFCLSKVEADPILVCEKGYNLNKNKCEAVVQLQAIIQGSKGIIDIELDCKNGKRDEDGNCYQIHTTEPVAVCDIGFNIFNNRCVSYIIVDPESDCPKGFENTKSNECIRTIKKKPICPDGYKKQHDYCEKIIKEEPVYVCPKGAVLEKNKCIILDTIEPFANCKKGYELSGTDCIRPGYVKAGKDKVYKPIYQCPKGFKYNVKTDSCITLEKSLPEVVCDKGYTLEDQRCVAYHSVDALLMCPKGYNYNESNKCVRVTYDRPIFNCPEGSEDHGKKCYVYSPDYKKKN